MKKFPHIISKLFYEPLILTRAKHAAMVNVLESHMAKMAMPMDDGDGKDDEPDDDCGYIETERTAIIPVNGVLVAKASDIPMSSCGCGLDAVSAMIDVAVADKNVRKILFYFKSPGGSVTGVPECGRKIAGIVSKSTVAFTDTECCSGALWLAEQCQQVYMTPSAAFGSIGVWCAYLDMSRNLDNEGVKVQEFSAGKYKTMGAYWKSLSKDESKMIQASVDKIYGQFKEAVQTRRVVADEFMQGQIFDGEEAVAAGLVDGLVESIEEVI
jgi:signal peptide peptidase SppA